MVTGDDQTRPWVPCAGSGEPTAEQATEGTRQTVTEPRGPRQSMAAYGTGRCPVCGQVRSVNLEGRMRPHAAPKGDAS